MANITRKLSPIRSFDAHMDMEFLLAVRLLTSLRASKPRADHARACDVVVQGPLLRVEACYDVTDKANPSTDDFGRRAPKAAPITNRIALGSDYFEPECHFSWCRAEFAQKEAAVEKRKASPVSGRGFRSARVRDASGLRGGRGVGGSRGRLFRRRGRRGFQLGAGLGLRRVFGAVLWL